MSTNTEQSYSQLLKDPRWQRKRLEIMQRDNFTCQICGHADKPLHVHHIHYEKGRMPWEYNGSQLITLCEDCHKSEHESSMNILGEIDYLKEHGALMIEIEAILHDVLIGLVCKRSDTFISLLGGDVENRDFEPQDWWGLDYPRDLCARLAQWRSKLFKK